MVEESNRKKQTLWSVKYYMGLGGIRKMKVKKKKLKEKKISTKEIFQGNLWGLRGIFMQHFIWGWFTKKLKSEEIISAFWVSIVWFGEISELKTKKKRKKKKCFYHLTPRDLFVQTEDSEGLCSTGARWVLHSQIPPLSILSIMET